MLLQAAEVSRGVGGLGRGPLRQRVAENREARVMAGGERHVFERLVQHVGVLVCEERQQMGDDYVFLRAFVAE